jgi:hypothetical protein
MIGPYSSLITFSTKDDSTSEASVMNFKFKWLLGPKLKEGQGETVYFTLNPSLAFSSLTSSSSKLTVESIGLSTSIIKFTGGGLLLGIDVPLIEYDNAELKTSSGDTESDDLISIMDEPAISFLFGCWGQMKTFNIMNGKPKIDIMFWLLQAEIRSYPDSSIISTSLGILVGGTI